MPLTHRLNGDRTAWSRIECVLSQQLTGSREAVSGVIAQWADARPFKPLSASTFTDLFPSLHHHRNSPQPLNTMHARRFSLEAFTRAGSDDSRKNIVDLSEGSSSAPRRLSQALADFASTSKAASRGHNRNSSIASQLSFTSVTSDGASSVATRRSSVRSDTGVTVVGADEVVKEGIVPSSPPPSAFKTIKSIFRRSLGGYVPIALNPSTIEVTKAGVLDRASLEKLIWERQGQIDRVTTFTMSKESYIGWGQLAETLEFLGRSLPTLKEVHIISQVFTLVCLHLHNPKCVVTDVFGHRRSFMGWPLRSHYSPISSACPSSTARTTPRQSVRRFPRFFRYGQNPAPLFFACSSRLARGGSRDWQ